MRGLVETPGSWLYRRPIIDWLSDASLVCQLPRAYRFFAGYCAAQKWHRPVGAEVLLRTIIALSARTSDADGIVPLHLNSATVFLDLRDPRFLRVPSEIDSLPSTLRHFLRPGDSFIDVGANHGTFSIVASRLVGAAGLVVAIEPQPRLGGLLQRSLAQSPARFEVHQIACGDHCAEIEFYIPFATSGSAGRFGRYSAVSRHRTIEVAMRPLDEVIDWRRLPGRTFIKLDVEGSEMGFLAGAQQLLRATAPALLMEVNPSAMRAADTSKAKLVVALRDLGYDRFINPKEPDRQQPLTDRIVDADLILLPASFETGDLDPARYPNWRADSKP